MMYKSILQDFTIFMLVWLVGGRRFSMKCGLYVVQTDEIL